MSATRRARRRTEQQKLSRRSARPLLLVLLQTLGLALLLELGLRVAWTPPPLVIKDPHRVQQMITHPTRMWAMAPGVHSNLGITTTVSEDGLRLGQLTGAAQRVLTLGDSTIYSHGLADKDSLHQQLADGLKARGVQADVLCGGVPGYSSEQTRLLMHEVGWDLEPTLLVIGNLWSDNSYAHFVDRQWMAALNTPLMRVGRVLQPLYLWRWARSVVSGDAMQRDDRQVATNQVSWIKEPNATATRRVSVQRYAQNLDHMLLQAAERGVGAVILQLPNRDRLMGREQSWGVYLEAQRAVADRRGVLVVDAVQSLQAANFTTEQAFQDPVHPTALAAGAMAEQLAEALVRADWPGQPLRPDDGPPPFDQALQDNDYSQQNISTDHLRPPTQAPQ